MGDASLSYGLPTDVEVRVEAAGARTLFPLPAPRRIVSATNSVNRHQIQTRSGLLENACSLFQAFVIGTWVQHGHAWSDPGLPCSLRTKPESSASSFRPTVDPNPRRGGVFIQLIRSSNTKLRAGFQKPSELHGAGLVLGVPVPPSELLVAD